MFDIGWDEMALVAVVALIVIGPKDLPAVLRQVGRWTRKARDLAGEFQRGVDEMVRESELADIKTQVEKATDPNLLRREVEKTVDPTGDIARSLEPPTMPAESPAQVEPMPQPELSAQAELPADAPFEAPRKPPEP